MADYIERGDAFDAVMGQFCACSDETEAALNGAIEDIRKIPAADVAPVVRGHWITDEEAEKLGDCSLTYSCSVCHHCDWDCTESFDFNFCPNCGADMREVQDG